MTHPTLSLPQSLYRPKKIPRIIRRQISVIRLTAIIVAFGLVALSVAYRNIVHEQVNLDVAQNRATITSLYEEIYHLHGLTESEASYPKIAAWAEKNHGWKPIMGRRHELKLRQESLTAGALWESKISETIHEQ
jgi:hypothetical protein